MADKEISELTAATTPLAGTELVHIDQGGNSRKVALTDVAALATGAMLKATYDPNDDGIIAVAQGGTNSATASGARTNLGLGTMAVQNAATVAITGGSVAGITDITVADGGTGSSTASGARTNLGLVIGTDVQAWNTNLDGFAATTVTNVQNRVNHTGTQLAATISDFSTAADLRIAAAVGVTVQAYDALLASVSALSLTAGDIVYSTGADAVANLAIGAEGQVLAVSGGIPAWGTELSVGGLLAANNLSDVASATTARTNLGVAIGTDVQAFSANLDTLAAVTPGSKGLAILADTTSDAVLTELGGGTTGKSYLGAETDAAAGTLMLPAILTILPKLTGDTIDLMLFTQAGVSPDRYGTVGSETLNNAAIADALTAMDDARTLGANVAIKLPWGVFRMDAPISISRSWVNIVGQGSGATRLITGDATIDMVTFTGGFDASGLSLVGISGVALVRDGTTPVPSGRTTPKQLNLTNVSNGIFSDIYIEKAGIGIYGSRLFDSMFNHIRISGATQSDRAGHAGIMLTSETGHSGTCFGNHITDFEIQYPGAGQTAAYVNGILVECSDGLYMHQGHILSCTNGIHFNPDGTATIRDKVGGVWVTDVYLDHCNDYGALIAGVASNYGRLFFDRVRFSFIGNETGVGVGCRVAPTDTVTTISDLEFGDCTFNECEASGLYVVNNGGTPVEYLKVSGSTFRNNNESNAATAADLRIEDGNNYFIEGNNIYGGGAAGTGILMASGAGAGTIENNDLSASTAGTKISIAGHNNGRKIVNNRETASGFSEIEREGVTQTTSTTPTLAWSLAVSEDWTVEVEFQAVGSHLGKTNAISAKRAAVFNRATAGSLVQEGTTSVVWTAEDNAGTDITIAASGNTIEARVVGLAATTINWFWDVKYKVRSA